MSTRANHSDRQLLDYLSRMPFIDSAELAGILGEPHTTVHRSLASLLADGIAGRVSHGTVRLPSSHRYYLTTSGVSEAAEFLGFETPLDFVRAYPVRSGRRRLRRPSASRHRRSGPSTS